MSRTRIYATKVISCGPVKEEGYSRRSGLRGVALGDEEDLADDVRDAVADEDIRADDLRHRVVRAGDEDARVVPDEVQWLARR